MNGFCSFVLLRLGAQGIERSLDVDTKERMLFIRDKGASSFEMKPDITHIIAVQCNEHYLLIGRSIGSVHGETDGETDPWTDERMDGGMDGEMEQQTDRNIHRGA